MAETGTTTGNTGYINGSDVLLSVGGKPIGHCTTHSITFNSETKEHAVKPLATLAKSSGLWKSKNVTSLSISISAEGVRLHGEPEGGFSESSPLWGKGQSVDVECFMRGDDASPYLKGKFVITKIQETSPAQDDATYSIELENDGEPEVYPGKVSA